MSWKKFKKGLSKTTKSVGKGISKAAKSTAKFVNKNAKPAYKTIIEPIGKGIVEKTGQAVDVVLETASAPAKITETITENSTTFLITAGILGIAFIFFQMNKN
jgi:hypothetical protein